MFVDIENLKSALAVENILTPYKKGRLAPDKKTRLPKEPITPQVCMEILKSTNYARNIKDMLLCIAELPASEQVQFEEVVLACVDNREQPNDILVLAKKLAVANGFENDLAEALKPKDGEFLLSDAKGAWGYRNEHLFFDDETQTKYQKWVAYSKDVTFNGYNHVAEQVVCPAAENVAFENSDLQNLRTLQVKEGAHLRLKGAKNLPDYLDAVACGKIYISANQLPIVAQWKHKDDALWLDAMNSRLSGEFDLTPYAVVNLQNSSFEEGTKFHFREGAKVNLSYARALPKDIDFSHCAEVNLESASLKNLNGLEFAKGAKVNLKETGVLPCAVDFSQCSEVNLDKCKLPHQTELKFAKGAKVILSGASQLPKDIDFSQCAEVILTGAKLDPQVELRFDEAKLVYLNGLSHLPNILNLPKCEDLDLSFAEFADGAVLNIGNVRKVRFYSTKNLPRRLDLSACDYVYMTDCDLKNLSNLKFAKGAEVYLNNSENLPDNIDVSGCKEIDLSGCDLRHQHQLKFAQGSKVVLQGSSRVPGNLDFSPCANIRFEDIYLTTQNALSFADGAVVSIGNARIDAPMVDFSNCDKIYSWQCDFRNVGALVFKDEKQFRETNIGRKSAELFFMDSLTDEQRLRLEKIKARNNPSLKQVWRSMTNLWGGRS